MSETRTRQAVAGFTCVFAGVVLFFLWWAYAYPGIEGLSPDETQYGRSVQFPLLLWVGACVLLLAVGLAVCAFTRRKTKLDPLFSGALVLAILGVFAAPSKVKAGHAPGDNFLEQLFQPWFHLTGRFLLDPDTLLLKGPVSSAFLLASFGVALVGTFLLGRCLWEEAAARSAWHRVSLALAHAGAAAAAVPALLALRSGSSRRSNGPDNWRPMQPSWRTNPALRASEVLARLEPQSAALVPALSTALGDPCVDIRSWAPVALSLFGAAAAPALPALRAALLDSNEDVRIAAQRAIDRIQSTDRNALMWLGSLKAPELNDRRFGLEHLKLLVPWLSSTAVQTVVPALAAVLADPDPTVRESAIVALGRCGPAARSAIEALLAIWQDGTSAERASAANALWAIDTDVAKAAGVSPPTCA